MTVKRIITKTVKSEGADPRYGFKEYGGVLIVMDCGHALRWDGGFPVPIPMPGEEHECPRCSPGELMEPETDIAASLPAQP